MGEKKKKDHCIHASPPFSFCWWVTAADRNLHIPTSVKHSCLVCKVWIIEQKVGHCPLTTPLSDSRGPLCCMIIKHRPSLLYMTACYRLTLMLYWHKAILSGCYKTHPKGCTDVGMLFQVPVQITKKGISDTKILHLRSFHSENYFTKMIVR